MPGSIPALFITSRKMAVIYPAAKSLQPSVMVRIFSRRYIQSSGVNSNYIKDNKAMRLPPNLIDSFNQNVSWFNSQYEKAFGIAEIRDMQNKVLAAESDFVDVTHQRKMCQDQIEKLKEEMKKIRDKLDITPRQSDNYLRLVTEEHKLLRDQLSLDVQLEQLKEREQSSLDVMSKLLRQSHEVERLRQERAKYWQIISLALSLAGSLIALIAQRVRSQKSIMGQLASYDARLSDMDESIRVMKQEVDSQHEASLRQLNMMNATLEEIALGLRAKTESKGAIGWASWVPGLSTIRSWTSYCFSPRNSRCDIQQ